MCPRTKWMCVLTVPMGKPNILAISLYLKPRRYNKKGTRWRLLTPFRALLRSVCSRSISVLVDAPLPVPDVLYLDGSYLRFLRFSQVNPHARVRSVARDMLASLEDAAD